MIFLDPKNDIAFRKIFGDENKKAILISFLNNILNFAGTPKEITDITIVDPYEIPKLDKLKECILATKIIDKRGIQYFIEIKLFHSAVLERIMMNYISKAYAHQLEIGDEYPKLNQVIFLGILDFVLFKDIPHYQTRHLILDEKNNGHFLKDLEFNFIEIPKFNKSLSELSDIKEKWIYFVKNARNLTLIPKEMEEPKEIREAFEAANRMTWTPQEFDAYENYAILIQEERGRIQYAKEEGREIGREEGIEIGIEKGEKSKALKVAKAMLEIGTAPEIVAKITELSIDEIQSLK